MEESKEVKEETKPVDESPSRSKDLSNAEDFVSVTIKDLQMQTTSADGIGCLKEQDVCVQETGLKLVEGHLFQRITLKEFAVHMNETHGNRCAKAVGVPNATKNCMACYQKEAGNETVRNSTCVAIETGRLRQMHELHYIYAGKHGG
ncbi:unnamed protein product [Larinioides sclopetarius]|uniref:Uncharacterized protein n=1 Tax=Larinioides sclopetarius TaxID=280406 RepID=A0AAV2BEG5_9ARAC